MPNAIVPPVCPQCGTAGRVVKFAFGRATSVMLAAEQRGELVRGGCVVTAASPAWRCLICRRDLGTEHEFIADHFPTLFRPVTTRREADKEHTT